MSTCAQSIWYLSKEKKYKRREYVGDKYRKLSKEEKDKKCQYISKMI